MYRDFPFSEGSPPSVSPQISTKLDKAHILKNYSFSMLHNFLAGKFKSERKDGPACFYDSNKQSYIIRIIVNCFYYTQKGSKNLAQLVRPYTRESWLDGKDQYH